MAKMVGVLVMPYSYAPTSSPRPTSDSSSSLAPALRPSIAMWPMAWPRLPGCANFSRSSIVPSSAPPLSTATILARSTSPQIPYTISARSTWRSTFTLFGSASTPVMFGFSTSRPRYSSMTSSPRCCHRVPSTIFAHVSTSVHDRVETKVVLEPR
jgi:hypothetical protein